MICVSVAEKGMEACINALKGIEFAEVRLDKAMVSEHEIGKVFSVPVKLIATCRPGKMSEEERGKSLQKAIEAGASFVDLELDMREEQMTVIAQKAREKGCKVIVSFHDHEKTPSREELERIVNACFKKGADIAKVACKVNSVQDNANLFGLLGMQRKIVVVGIGAKGRITRVVAPFLGSQFTYAAHSKGKETAEGQMEKAELEKAIAVIKSVIGTGGK